MDKDAKLHCCPRCGSDNASTIDSRYLDDLGWRRRRRVCRACAHRWSTVEVPAELLGQMKRVFEHLQEIERLATEARLTLLGARITAGFGEPGGPARTEC